MVKRFPAQIGNWKIKEDYYDLQGLLGILRKEINISIQRTKRPGILLSGGIDSSILATMAKAVYPSIPCFVIGNSKDHPDICAAMRLAREIELNLYVYMPNCLTIINTKKHLENRFKGDEAVYLILKYASHFTNYILAGDGIDEQMGGYWEHTNENRKFSSREKIFQYFWDVLEEKHLSPAFQSAQKTGVSIDWVFLHDKIVNYIARIPISERIKNNIPKAIWRDFARLVGIPEWIINRPKRGFNDAFTQ